MKTTTWVQKNNGLSDRSLRQKELNTPMGASEWEQHGKNKNKTMNKEEELRIKWLTKWEELRKADLHANKIADWWFEKCIPKEEIENKLLKEKEKECRHSFKLEKIDTETSISTSATPFYKKVGYAICEKCGLIIKQDV